MHSVEELHACNSKQYRGSYVAPNKTSKVGAPVDAAQDEAEYEVESDDYIDIAYALVDAVAKCDEGSE